MDETASSAVSSLDLAWGQPSTLAICEQCDWAFVVAAESLPPQCPHCFRASLTPIEASADLLPRLRPPELMLPFTVSEAAVLQAIQNFAQGGWFAPRDLTPRNLHARLQRIYLPMWLVDGKVEAQWQAEVDFDYEVVSHQNLYSDSRGWREHAVTEKRIRWERRLGRLRRAYANVLAPAMEEHAHILRQLGAFAVERSQAATPQGYAGALVRLPNRLPQDAWSDAQAGFQAAAAAECQQAAAAQHIRAYQWTPKFSDLNWTLLLLPVLTSYYLDDERQPVTVMLHGQSGRLSGLRRASMKRAQTAALWIGAIATLIFVLSVLLAGAALFFPPLLVLAGAGMLLAGVVGLSAVIPLLVSWNVNRKNRQAASL